MQILEKKIRLSEPQSKVISAEKPIISFIGGTGAGKTFIGANWSRDKAGVMGDGLIAAPSYKMLNRSTLPKFLEMIEGTTLEGEMKWVKMEYHCSNGAVIYFGSADKPLTLDGPHVYWAWIDEAGITNISTFHVVLSRVGQKNGQLLITTTPNLIKTKNWIYHELYEKRHEDYIDYIHSISIDNPVYSKEFFERMKKVLDNRTFAIRHLGKFIRSQGLVYYEILDKVFINKDNLPNEWRGWKDWQKYIAIDPGVKYAILFFAYNPETGQKLVYDEYRTDGLRPIPASKIAEIILKKEKDFRKIYYDPARLTDATNLAYEIEKQSEKLTGERFKPHLIMPVVRKVHEGISEVIRGVKEGKVRVLDHLSLFKDEIESYHYPMDESGKVIDDLNPVKEDDDLMDAWRYGVGKVHSSIIAGSYVRTKTKTDTLKDFIERRRRYYER